jgi:preprotein translocase subunit SecB
MGRFQLKRYFPSDIQYTLSDNLPSGESKIECSVSFQAGHSTDNPLDWKVTTKTTFRVWKDDNDLVKGHVTFVGFFVMPDDIEASERNSFIGRNATPVLYSATREVIANLTARAPMNAIALPHMSFEKFGSQDAKSDEVEDF